VRFTLVALPAVLFVRRPAARFRDVAAVGLLMSVGQFGLLYSALHLGMPPGLASLVLQAQVMLTVVVAAWRLGERPRPPVVAGVAVGTVGLVVVAVGRGGSSPALAFVLTLGAALSWAVGNVAARRIGSASGLSLTVWSATVVPAPLLAASLLLDGPHAVVHGLAHLPVSALLSTAYTVVLASLVGFGIWNSLLARYPAASVTPFALLVPPVGIATAWLVQGERPGVAEVAGGLLLLAGVAVTVLSNRPKPLPRNEIRRPAAAARSGAVS
jgi:O-acetylserine/cysteine efflux transporter